MSIYIVSETKTGLLSVQMLQSSERYSEDAGSPLEPKPSPKGASMFHFTNGNNLEDRIRPVEFFPKWMLENLQNL